MDSHDIACPAAANSLISTGRSGRLTTERKLGNTLSASAESFTLELDRLILVQGNVESFVFLTNTIKKVTAMQNFNLVIILFLLTSCGGNENWPGFVFDISIKSSIDGSKQKAKICHGEPGKPLMVVLHEWSADYTSEKNIYFAEWCKSNGWSFVAPNYRGPNTTPDACGSEKAIQDIVDSIEFASEKCRSAKTYIVGVSGGGHAALLVVLKYQELFSAASVWVPITNLSDWYYECKQGGLKYCDDMELVFGGSPENFGQLYYHRSPIKYANKCDVPIDINTGVLDGHTGSVPITHSIKIFSAITGRSISVSAEILNGQPVDVVSGETCGDRLVYFRTSSGGHRLTIFDGGHEIIQQAAIDWFLSHNDKEYAP